jgi:hypothetical protein
MNLLAIWLVGVFQVNNFNETLLVALPRNITVIAINRD